MVSLLPGILRRDSGKTSAKNPAANTAWWLFERGLRLLITATLFAAVARHLGPVEFGALNYAVSVMLTFAAVSTLGLDAWIVQSLVRRPDFAGTLLGTAVVLRLGLAVIGLLLLLVLTRAAPSVTGDPVLLMTASLALLLQPFEVAELWFQRHLQARRAVLARIAMMAAGGTARVILVLSDAPLWAFAAAVVLDHLAYSLGLMVLYGRDPDAPRWRTTVEDLRMVLRQAVPLGCATIFAVLQFRLEYVLAGRWLDGPTAGQYFAALRLTEFWLPIGMAVATTLLPLWGERTLRERDAAPTARRMFDLLALTGFVIAIGGTLVLPWLLPWVLGREYAGAASLAVIKAWAAPFLFTGLIRAQWLTLRNALAVQAALALLGAVTLFALSSALVPRWGATGLAAASVLTAIFVGPLASALLPGARDCAHWHAASLVAWLRPSRIGAALGLLR